MSAQTSLRSLVREAELYRIQGLLTQSREKYIKVLDLAKKSRPSAKRQKVIDAVTDRIHSVDRELVEFREETEVPKLPEKVHGLIKKLFAFSKTEETAALEGAIALAKFGQYEQALDEFNLLLTQKKLALIAAKNILRCHLSLASPQAAVDQFTQWAKDKGPLKTKDLGKVREFLKGLLESVGVPSQLPELTDPGAAEKAPEIEKADEDIAGRTPGALESDPTKPSPAPSDSAKIESMDDFSDISKLGEPSDLPEDIWASDNQDTNELDEILDISSIKIRFDKAGVNGKVLEFKVTFQVGNVVSVILPSRKKPLLRYLSPETELPTIRVYSPMTDFEASGKVLGKTDVKSGPNKGDTMLDIIVYAS